MEDFEMSLAGDGAPSHEDSSTPSSEDHVSTPSRHSSDSFASYDSVKFEDGVRSIDMILVYKEDGNPVNEDKRKMFEKLLRSDGLQLEKAGCSRKDSKLVFLKIHAASHVLAEFAEIHDMRVGFSDIIESANEYPKLLGMMSTSPGYRTLRATFREEDIEGKLEMDQEDVFTSSERSSIVYSILRTTRYGDDQNAVGLPRLLTEKVYLDVYPLHDGKHNVEPPPDFSSSDRRILYMSWSRPLAFFRRQPLDLVNKYFGDEVSLYFAWLGCYTSMLVPASIVGVIIMLISWGLAAAAYDISSEEICNTSPEHDMVLCPRCSLKFCHETVVMLSASCTQSRMAYLMDNYATIFNAFCMAFWATAYGEVWKRQLTILQWRWDLQSAEIDYDLRPQFLESVKTMRYNPILKKHVPYVPWRSHILRMALSYLGTMLMMLLSICSFIFVVFFKLSLKAILSEHKLDPKLSGVIMSLSGPVLSIILMTILGSIFQPLSFYLTDLEMPRTQAAYEKSRTFKAFAFSFVNSYALLLYLAFFKGQFYTYPGDTSQQALAGIVDLGSNQCDASGCITELIIQLFVTLIVKQGISNVGEVLKPQMSIWWRQWRWHRKSTVYKKKGKIPRWEEEYLLRPVTIFTLSAEVQEMVIQYGFTMLFVAVFPLAPLFALLNNIAEIRVDANKLLVQSRRSIARKVSDLGAWESLMTFLTYVAILTNGVLIAFTSDSVPETLHIIEHHTTGDYLDKMYSYFPIAELPKFQEAVKKVRGHENDTYCRYYGLRQAPWQDHAYEFRYEHWKYLAYKLGLVVLFASVVLGATAVFSYLFPDIPWLVKEQMMFEKDEAIKTKKFLQKGHNHRHSTAPNPFQSKKISSALSHLDRNLSLMDRRLTPYFPSDQDLNEKLHRTPSEEKPNRSQGFLFPAENIHKAETSSAENDHRRSSLESDPRGSIADSNRRRSSTDSDHRRNSDSDRRRSSTESDHRRNSDSDRRRSSTESDRKRNSDSDRRRSSTESDRKRNSDSDQKKSSTSSELVKYSDSSNLYTIQSESDDATPTVDGVTSSTPPKPCKPDEPHDRSNVPPIRQSSNGRFSLSRMKRRQKVDVMNNDPVNPSNLNDNLPVTQQNPFLTR